ncbi:MAG: tetratricopeptide repeat protein, partial [Vicinamibacterales bacterium]
MSHRKHATHTQTADDRYDDEPARPSPYTWIVYAVAMLLVGGLAGYALSIAGTGGGAPAATTSTAASAPVSGAPAAGMVDDVALKAYRDILARDPKNFQAAVSAGNMFYDAKRYEEAIPFYQQAMDANGRDVNVSTDLGTALWYTGRADAALAQYAVSLTIDAAHAQTLYNMGIVRS